MKVPNNITQRNKSNFPNKNISVLEDTIQSPLGDTIREDHSANDTLNMSTFPKQQPLTVLARNDNTITLHQFNLLLQQNNKSIIDAITDKIHREI